MAVRSFPSDIHLMRERRRRETEDGEACVQERAGIDSYRDIVSFPDHAPTRQAFVAILATEEEEHPDEWLSFLEEFGAEASAGR